MQLTQQQIDELKKKGLTDQKISALAQQNGYTMPEPKTLTFAQVGSLREKGLSDEKIRVLAQQNGFQIPEVGGVQSFVQGLAKPVLKLVSTARAIPEVAMGDMGAEKRNYNYGVFGNVAPIQGPGEAIGVGAELGSYAIGGGGVAGTAAAGLKGQLIRGGLQGLATGAASGGTMSFGQAIQESEVRPSDVAYKTLFGTAIGGALGLGLGTLTPVAAQVTGLGKKIYNLRTAKDIEPINAELQKLNMEVFKPTPKTLEKWSRQGKDPMKTYTEIFGKDIPEVGKDNRFTREGINDAVERVNDVYKPAAEGFNTILRNSPEVNSISKAQSDAIRNLDVFDLTPEMRIKAEQRIIDNFVAIKEEAIKKGVLLGDDSIPVWYSDNLKDRFWKVTKNFGTEDATVANSVNSAIGHGFKDSIENSITDLNVKNYNRHLGDLIVLRDFLETKIGALAGTGGKATRLISRLAGTVVGSQGGPITMILGNITGDKLAQIMIDPAYQPMRWLINKELKKLPQARVLQLENEANDVLKQMFQRRMETLALPAPKTEMIAGRARPVIKSQTKPIIAGGATTYEPAAQKIGSNR